MSDEVMAVTDWKSNAELIRDVAKLHYLDEDWPTVDATYGKGTWWKLWRPRELAASDIDPELSPTGTSIDFTALPYQDASFQVGAYDPPYKLNGTPTARVDARYGVAVYTKRDDRHRLMVDGMTEYARVIAPGGFLLVKCQDQVNGGKVRWQTDMMSEHGKLLGLDKVDVFHFLGYRPQDAERSRPGCPECWGKLSKVKAGSKCRTHGIVVPIEVLVEQEHARRNHSTLLVFKKPRRRRAAQAVLL